MTLTLKTLLASKRDLDEDLTTKYVYPQIDAFLDSCVGTAGADDHDNTTIDLLNGKYFNQAHALLSDRRFAFTLYVISLSN